MLKKFTLAAHHHTKKPILLLMQDIYASHEIQKSSVKKTRNIFM